MACGHWASRCEQLLLCLVLGLNSVDVQGAATPGWRDAPLHNVVVAASTALGQGQLSPAFAAVAAAVPRLRAQPASGLDVLPAASRDAATPARTLAPAPGGGADGKGPAFDLEGLWRADLDTELSGVRSELKAFEESVTDVDRAVDLVLSTDGSQLKLEKPTDIHDGLGNDRLTIKPLILVPTILVLIFLVMLWRSGHIIGWLVDMAIESMDKEIFGVDVHVEKCYVSVSRGFIEVFGVVFDNPEGFYGDNLFSIKYAKANLGWIAMMRGMFGAVYVDELTFTDVDVNYEKGVFGESNCKWVMDFMKGKHKEEEQEQNRSWSFLSCRSGGKKPVASAASASAGGSSAESLAAPKKKKHKKVVIRKLQMEGVNVSLAAKFFGGASMKVKLTDIHYDNFTDAVGTENPHGIAKAIALDLLGCTEQSINRWERTESGGVPLSDSEGSATSIK